MERKRRREWICFLGVSLGPKIMLIMCKNCIFKAMQHFISLINHITTLLAREGSQRMITSVEGCLHSWPLEFDRVQ